MEERKHYLNIVVIYQCNKYLYMLSPISNVMRSKLFRRATNPKQYDFDDVRWSEVEYGLENSGTRMFHYAYIRKFAHYWKNADILDIGCGTGWLLEEMRKQGAQKVIGIDPSHNNIKKGKQLYPNLMLIQSDFESFHTTKKFDVITCVMVFEHIAKIKRSLAKIKDLLKDEGILIIIVADFDYFKTPRHEYGLLLDILNESEYAVQVNRKEGVIADIVRTLDYYKSNLDVSGLDLIDIQNMMPPAGLRYDSARFNSFKEKSIAHLIVAKKKQRRIEMENDINAMKKKSGAKKYVACFGKSSIAKNGTEYAICKEIGSMIIFKGYGVLHGGYSGGCMEAVATGAEIAIKSMKLSSYRNIGVPLEDFDKNWERIRFGTFCTPAKSLAQRVSTLVENSDAIVVLPKAGMGTLLEAIYTLHYNQIAESLNKRTIPIIFFGENWHELILKIYSILDMSNQSNGSDWIYYANTLEEFNDVLDIIVK